MMLFFIIQTVRLLTILENYIAVQIHRPDSYRIKKTGISIGSTRFKSGQPALKIGSTRFQPDLKPDLI